MKMRLPASAVMVFCILATTAEMSYGVPLFNRMNLSGWTHHGSPWIVSRSGILQNTGMGNANDWIECNKQLPPDPFTLEIRIRVVDCTNTTPRPRVILVAKKLPYEIHDVGKIYFGNEGFVRQFEIYGDDLTNINQVADGQYAIGDWHTLCFDVDGRNQVSFFKDGVLTHTATRITQSPLNIIIRPGDSWSAGHIEISSVDYVPEPATLLLLGLGAAVLLRSYRAE